jgi:hypothetical protein
MEKFVDRNSISRASRGVERSSAAWDCAAPEERDGPADDAGAPEERDGPADDAGAPEERDGPADDAGAPEERDGPADDAGAPEVGLPEERVEVCELIVVSPVRFWTERWDRAGNARAPSYHGVTRRACSEHL